MTALRTTLLGFSVLLGACSVKSLPPGTPPPEYEKRTHEPWPPPSPDAGTEPSAPPAAPGAPEAIPGASDAGVLDAAPGVPAADAGSL